MDMTGNLPVIFFCNDIAVGPTRFVILSVAKYLETALIDPSYRQDDNFEKKMNRWSTVILLPILSHILHHNSATATAKNVRKSLHISTFFYHLCMILGVLCKSSFIQATPHTGKIL
jgi:hypothetical protein